MDETCHYDIPQVSELENEILVSPFSEEEVKMAVFQMKHNTTLGSDGFPAEFYQTFWFVIKEDLMALFMEFHKGTLPLHNLNFGTIILLPKGNNVKQIQQYRPICLLNVSFKIFTKVVTSRVTSIAARVIKPTQIAFLPSRNIKEGAVILHETIHELHTKKQNGVIFKIDFEKAYDKVRWEFLQQALRIKGFNSTWCTWVQTCVQGGNVRIKVNGQLGSYFQTRKGLRQVVDMLAIIVARAKAIGLFKGVVPHLVDDDDTVLFLDHDLNQAKNMKLVLCLFEQLLALKINFHKNEIFCFGGSKRVGELEDDKKENRKKVEQLEMKNAFFWQEISFVKLDTKRCLEKNRILSISLLLAYNNHKKKYRPISWPILCQPKEQGGLEVQNLDIQNKCLLSKWLFKHCNEDGIWQNLLRNKYLKENPLSQTEKKSKGLTLLGKSNGRQFKLVSGNQIRFWEGRLSRTRKHAMVAEVLRTIPYNVSFRRALTGNKFNEWHNLVARIASVNLREGRDQYVWPLHNKGYFSVSSMYKHLVSNGLKVSQEIWHLKIPLKRGVILTKDNLAKRNWRVEGIVNFVASKKLSNTFFLNVIMLNFFGMRFT
ncbi:hypothetical protein U9M48_000597, partial [Paspalum notatum var. saurae]